MKKIKIVDENYDELFSLADGERMVVTLPDGEKITKPCKYIDDYHFFFGNNVYHIHEFGEHMAKNGNSVSPLLPEMCYTMLYEKGALIVITRGEKGYNTTSYSSEDVEKNIETVDFLNSKLGVTKAEEKALTWGSLFGWNTQGADPRNYDENGKTIHTVKGKESER